MPAEAQVARGNPFDLQLPRGGGRNGVEPRHGGLKGGIAVEIIVQQAVEPLGVVHKVAYAVVGGPGQAIVAAEVELTLNVAQTPVALARVEEVDTQARYHVAAVGVLLPVEGEGVEVVVAEVEHGVDLVLYALAQPALYILVYGLEGVPAARGVAGGVVILAHGAAADLDPRFQRLDRPVEGADDFADVIPAPLG